MLVQALAPAERAASPTPTSLPDEPVGVTVVPCPGPRLGGRAAVRFVRSVLPTCAAGRPVVVDLSAVASLDAAGLLAVAQVVRTVRAAGGEARLCGTSPAVRAVLAGAGIHHLA